MSKLLQKKLLSLILDLFKLMLSFISNEPFKEPTSLLHDFIQEFIMRIHFKLWSIKVNIYMKIWYKNITNTYIYYWWENNTSLSSFFRIARPLISSVCFFPIWYSLILRYISTEVLISLSLWFSKKELSRTWSSR